MFGARFFPEELSNQFFDEAALGGFFTLAFELRFDLRENTSILIRLPVQNHQWNEDRVEDPNFSPREEAGGEYEHDHRKMEDLNRSNQ